MSIAGRSTLINSSLDNALIYHMSIYLLLYLRSSVAGWIKLEYASFGRVGVQKRNIILLNGQNL